jgi:multicomponent Na+:H+ antiporter subunit E
MFKYHIALRQSQQKCVVNRSRAVLFYSGQFSRMTVNRQGGSVSSLTRYSKVLPAAIFWLLFYGAVWLLLSRGQGLGFGLLFSMAATAVALRLELRPWTFRVLYLPAAVAFFIRVQLHGAWNVSRRTLQISCRLQPAWVAYRCNCEDQRIQLFLSAVVGLLPGTLAARVEADTMYLHLLDVDMEWRPTIVEMERQLVRLLARGGKS